MDGTNIAHVVDAVPTELPCPNLLAIPVFLRIYKTRDKVAFIRCLNESVRIFSRNLFAEQPFLFLLAVLIDFNHTNIRISTGHDGESITAIGCINMLQDLLEAAPPHTTIPIRLPIQRL